MKIATTPSRHIEISLEEINLDELKLKQLACIFNRERKKKKLLLSSHQIITLKAGTIFFRKSNFRIFHYIGMFETFKSFIILSSSWGKSCIDLLDTFRRKLLYVIRFKNPTFNLFLFNFPFFFGRLKKIKSFAL